MCRGGGDLVEHLTGYGVRLALAATERTELDLLREGLPGTWTRASGRGAGRTYSLGRDTDGLYVLRADGRELERTGEAERVLEVFVASAGFYVGESSRSRTFVHAGVVGWRGAAIVLPGRPETGKTTLTAALVRAGAGYLSDEYAPLDDDGLVHPFPRRLSIRGESGARPRLERVETLGGVQEKRALPVALVLLTAYTGVKRWRPRRATPGEAVLEILKHTVSGQARPHEALDRLAKVTARAPVLKGGRGEAAEVAPAILRRLDALLPAPPPAS